MPEVPKRPLSPGEYNHKRISITPNNDQGTRDWKKPTYESSLPHPLKCSKCDYIADTVSESKQHWFDSHD